MSEFTEAQKVVVVLGATGGIFSSVMWVWFLFKFFVNECSKSDYDRELSKTKNTE